MRTKKFIPDLRGLLFLLGVAAFLSVIQNAHAYEQVLFSSLETKVELTGYLLRPEGEGPFPAVVMMHGCGGLVHSGAVSPLYSSWAQTFSKLGLAVLMVDSAGSRRLGATCTKGKERVRMYRERPKDAYGALAYLQAQKFIRADRIGLVGWSQGGAVVLLSAVQGSIGRPVPPPRHDFAAAAAFYPALCNDRIQSRPFTKVAPGTWSTMIPLLVLQGGADNWTRPGPCEEFIEAVKRRGSPVSMVVYPGAYHGFDAPALKMRELPRYKTVTGVIPIVGTNKEARQDALKRLPAFLSKYLLSEN